MREVFENLVLYAGTAFAKDDTDCLVKDISDGSILHWTKEARRLAQKVSLSATMEEKQLVKVSYFFEVIDDLMMEPRHNVSQRCSAWWKTTGRAWCVERTGRWGPCLPGEFAQPPIRYCYHGPW